MAKTYAQLVNDIEALKSKAELARKKEAAGVVTRIREAVQAYGLTAEDLGFGAAATAAAKSAAGKDVVPRAAKKAKAAAKKSPLTVKYRDGAGHQWSGRGPQPNWLKAAIAAGQSLESMAADTEGAESTPAAEDGDVASPFKPAAKSEKTTLPPKYKDDAGHVWSGRGPTPGWLRDAIAGGKTLEEMAA